MKPSVTSRPNRDLMRVALAATCASITSFMHYFRTGDLLLYGDAVAHINIARRVFDSRTPGPLQLGTVWLPLPHVLTMPFIVNRAMWQTGIGGSIPSMVAYVFAVVGVFRLACQLAQATNFPGSFTRMLPLTAAALFGLNPNLLYMQASAMTETLYLALFVWSVVYFLEFWIEMRGQLAESPAPAPRSLLKCGLCVAAACLTRYDGWFLAAALCIAIAIIWVRVRKTASPPRFLIRFVLLAAAIPLLWFLYNAIVYRNPLEFANGPYSAKAIEQRNSASATHPGDHNPAVAAAYFVKCAVINVAQGVPETLWLLLALAGSIIVFVRDRRNAAGWLLWVPVLFYTLSIAYGSVPIYMPDWWPHTAYNVRYGLQLLPALAVFVPFAFAWIATSSNSDAVRYSTIGIAILFLAASYAAVWRATPVCYLEASVNSRTRLALESQLADQLRRIPVDASFLMYLGAHVGALQQAGIPLRRSVNEGNHRVWVQPTDPQGLWERSLADPAAHVDYIVAIDQDPVAQAVHGRQFPAAAQITVTGQPTVTIYKTH